MTAAAPASVFQFGEFELDPVAYELRRRGRRLRLARQPMDLLLLMVGRRNELVSRDDIAARLWPPDVFLDRDAGIHTAVLRIRQVLRDSHINPRFLENVSGKGYRFIAPVEIVPRALSVAPPESSGVPIDVPPARRHNLPDELTSFVGRQEAIAELRRLLGANRLVSLTGAGGVGKTRLALRIASDILHACHDGVWMVDLGPITAADLVPQTVASVLGVHESGQRGVRDALTASLRHRQLLIVLDTCEHVLDACADLVEALLRDAPGVRILATTREPLGVRGEAVFRVPSLTLPVGSAEIDGQAPESEAVQLFVERAMTLDATFNASEADAGAIGRICQRLDGMPLAIELAAARVTLLSPAQIETRLQDRFKLLTGGARTAVARQRTLEAAVEWSCQLLSDSERHLLGRLSVFPASWTIEAAESICSGDGLDPCDVLELSSRLVAKSLVGLQRDQEGVARFRLLETVRQYARERVVPPDAGERLRTRHAGFFANQFRDALSVLRGAGQLPYLAQLQAEQENVRTALEWALASSALAAQGVALTGSLFWFWTKRGLFEEGKQWLERALTLEPTGLTRARVLIGLAHMHYFQGRHVAAAEAASEAHALGETLHHGWTVSFALFMLALTSFELGQCECAAATAMAARAAADAGGDPIQHGAADDSGQRRAAGRRSRSSAGVLRGIHRRASPRGGHLGTLHPTVHRRRSAYPAEGYGPRARVRDRSDDAIGGDGGPAWSGLGTRSLCWADGRRGPCRTGRAAVGRVRRADGSGGRCPCADHQLDQGQVCRPRMPGTWRRRLCAGVRSRQSDVRRAGPRACPAARSAVRCGPFHATHPHEPARLIEDRTAGRWKRAGPDAALRLEPNQIGAPATRFARRGAAARL